MNVVIRTDASIQIGTGHVRRCVTLASALKDAGVSVTFICQEVPGHLGDWIRQEGFPVIMFPATTGAEELSRTDLWEADWNGCQAILSQWPTILDWIVVDHYGLDSRWERNARRFSRNIFVIDDLADRPHDADLLLDQGLHNQAKDRYTSLIPSTSVGLFGPRYALLTRAIIAAGQQWRVRHDLKRVMVFMGGSDPNNVTGTVLRALKDLPQLAIHIDVVVGITNPYRDEIKQQCSEIPDAAYHCQTSQMAELTALADLAIGGGGTASWERCFLGLPTLVVLMAENQRQSVQELTDHGAVEPLASQEEITPEIVRNALIRMRQRPARLAEMSMSARRVMDADSFQGADGVAHAMVRLTHAAA